MKINFVESIEPYIKKLPASAEVGAGMRYTIKNTKIAESLCITSVNTCTGFLVIAGKKKLGGHIMPERLNIPDMLKELERIVNNFQARFGRAKAFVFGGRESSFVDPNCPIPSCDVYGNICATFSTKCHIPDEDFASILGKRADIKTFDDVAVIGDEIYFANKTLKTKSLEEIYEDIEIPKSFLA